MEFWNRVIDSFGNKQDGVSQEYTFTIVLGWLTTVVSQEYTFTIVLGWLTTVARYIFYLLIIRGFQEVLRLNLSLALTAARAPRSLWRAALTWAACGAALLALRGKARAEDIILLSVAYVVHQYLFKEHPLKPTINYGTGMACSFFQGYLKLVIPGDGTQQQDSFVAKICKWEDSERVVFPVKKLLIVITTSLWCPPDLRHFNRHGHPELPQIEACEPLEEVQKDVAGVKNRSYKNSAYKIYWPDGSHPPVYVAAECATPIHTLHGVIHAQSLYRELVGVDTNELVEDFCAQLERVVSRSPDCAGVIEIVRFDDSPNSGQYLPQVLVDKVAALEPEYLRIIERREALNDHGGPQRRPPPPPGPQEPQGPWARYIFYLLIIRGFQEVLRLNLSLALTAARAPRSLWRAALTWAACGAALLALRGKARAEDIILLSVAYVVHQYLFKEHPLKPTINYGTGMACSFFQGYLKLVIPGDGTQQQDSFVAKICKWEDSERVVFPVKKLLIVITTSLWCPPDLRHFNRHGHPELPQIEACEPLEEVQKDVAGVKNRSYKNSAYKIYWPDGSHPPVYVAAECATPIHTLHGVIHAQSLYRELVGVDTNELVEDFCAQLERVVSRSPDCAGVIEIVRFDDSPNSGQYLPQVLVDKVAALEPEYLRIIERREALNDHGGPQRRPPPPPGPQEPQGPWGPNRTLCRLNRCGPSGLGTTSIQTTQSTI